MSVGLGFDELLTWNEEVSAFWKAHLAANPALLDLPCGIGGAETVLAFVRHIWSVDLRWAQRLTNLPEITKDEIPQGPLDALYAMHSRAVEIYRGLLADASQDWSAPYTLTAAWVPAELRTMSRRKVMGHVLLHGQRHWAQLATLVRNAGFPSGFRGDLLFSSGLA